MNRRDVLTGAAGLLGAAVLPGLARANVPTPFSFDMAPPTNDLAKFVEWGVKTRGDDGTLQPLDMKAGDRVLFGK